MDGFYEIKENETFKGEVVKPSSGNDKLMGAVADNFENILSLASDVISIQKMKAQSDAAIAQMREAREQLIAETDSYVKRKNADTSSIVERMEVVRRMMSDFYMQNKNNSLSSEDFCKVMTEIINQMGKMKDE